MREGSGSALQGGGKESCILLNISAPGILLVGMGKPLGPSGALTDVTNCKSVI